MSYRFGVVAAYCSNFGHFAFLSHPLRCLRTTYDVYLRLIGKRVVDFLLVLIELFFVRCYVSGHTSENRSFLWCCHSRSSTFSFLFESQQPLFPPYLTSSLHGMYFPKNFANLSMMSPCHCHLIFLSPVRHHHHHHHHFRCASLHLSFTPDSKLTFSINPSHHCLPRIFGRISRIFMTISGLICLLFCFILLFSSILFDSYDRLSWFW